MYYVFNALQVVNAHLDCRNKAYILILFLPFAFDKGEYCLSFLIPFALLNPSSPLRCSSGPMLQCLPCGKKIQYQHVQTMHITPTVLPNPPFHHIKDFMQDECYHVLLTFSRRCTISSCIYL